MKIGQEQRVAKEQLEAGAHPLGSLAWGGVPWQIRFVLNCYEHLKIGHHLIAIAPFKYCIILQNDEVEPLLLAQSEDEHEQIRTKNEK